jgi:hypothetical protein
MIRRLQTTILLLVLVSAGCVQKRTEKNTDVKTDYYALGKEVVDASFSTLSTQLQDALAEGGVKNAVEYCNFMANPLIDSLSREYNAEIRRTTLKARNVLNKPRDYENVMLRAFMENYEEDRLLKPIVENLMDGGHVYYSPIIIKSGLCLSCHGEVGTNISEEDYKIIKKLYPTDQAVGYKLDDMRGVWSIVFYN